MNEKKDEESVVVCPPPEKEAKAEAIRKFVKSRGSVLSVKKILDKKPDDVHVCGGGVENTILKDGKVKRLDEEVEEDENAEA